MWRIKIMLRKNKGQKSKILAFSSMLGQKRGWIRIIEAFIGILLVIGIVLTLMGGNRLENETSSRVYNEEVAILRDIQIDDTLRAEILATSGTVEWESFPANTKSRIESKTPSYLECSAKICAPGDLCSLDGKIDGNVYAESVLITSDLNTFNPRQLKLFCWEKG